jgi:TPR repeat protein
MSGKAGVYQRGVSYLVGLKKAPDITRAVALFHEAAERGHPVSRDLLVLLEASWPGAPREAPRINKRVENALAGLREAADNGDPFAQNLMGALCERSPFLRQDQYQAARWYRRSANGNFPPAMVSVARLTLRGTYAEMEAKARSQALLVGRTAQTTARIGIFPALLELALTSPPTVEPATPRARGSSTFTVGWPTERGSQSFTITFGKKDTSRHMKEALRWVQKAADAEYPAAMTLLGTAYLHGRGFAKDEKQAIGWFRKAADRGDSDAIKQLAELGK